MPAEMAQSMPRARKESAIAPGVKSARVPRKSTGNSPLWLASSTRKKLCVSEMKPDTPKEIGKCQNRRESRL